MGFKCGIVGLPNVGKSTLFNALTKAGIEASNYPFCTIEPNEGIVPVPDARLDKIAEITKPQNTLPTVVKFVDIAGLVEGAAKGEGLGNKFLAHIRETQAIVHVVRCFENDDITHVAGRIDPISDVEIINTELALADLESVEKALIKIAKKTRSGDKEAQKEEALLKRLAEHLNGNKPARSFEVNGEQEENALNMLSLLTTKPVLYVANVDENSLKGNDYVKQLETLAFAEGSQVVCICAGIESEVAELADAEKLEFLNDFGLEEPGLNRLIRAGYELLDLETYFTAGPKEVRAWTYYKGSRAPQAAGVIHSDFEKGFIRAEVVAYDDFVAYGGNQGAKEAGKLRSEGKEYVVHDGDVILFRFNV